MAWIEVDQDLWKAIWIDGYLPSSESLEKTRCEFLDLDGGEYLIKRPYLTYSDDEIFKRLDLVIRRRYCDERKSKEGDLSYLFHHCDSFLTQFSSPHPSENKIATSLTKPEFKLGQGLKRELMKENQNKNYRQLIVTFSPYVCDRGEECTRQFIETVNFKIREPKKYDNFDDFKKHCQIFLERYFLEPYIAPCMTTEKRLKFFGFEIKAPDV